MNKTDFRELQQQTPSTFDQSFYTQEQLRNNEQTRDVTGFLLVLCILVCAGMYRFAFQRGKQAGEEEAMKKLGDQLVQREVVNALRKMDFAAQPEPGVAAPAAAPVPPPIPAASPSKPVAGAVLVPTVAAASVIECAPTVSAAPPAGSAQLVGAPALAGDEFPEDLDRPEPVLSEAELAQLDAAMESDPYPGQP